MHIRKFQPGDYPALVDIHTSLGIVWPEQPRSAVAWASLDASRSPKNPHARWVAVEAGRPVGFAACWRGPAAYPPLSFQIDIQVHPQFQRRGIGGALYERLVLWLQAYAPPALRADAFTNLPQGFPFLVKRGFYEAFRETPVHLEVAAFDPRPYAGLEPTLEGEGIVIRSLPELAGDPGRERKLYDLYWEAEEDLPREGSLSERPDFSDWLGWGLNDPCMLQEAYFVAVHGKEYVGLRELYSYGDGGVLLGSLLGVRRGYRRRGIGLALQLRGIAYARQHGYRLLKTCTALQNTRMQALFDKLGFARDPQWQQCQKDL
jgi:GNAT superfamily N-acetyltransferase